MLADKLPSREMILAELEYRATHRIESFYPETGPVLRKNSMDGMDPSLNVLSLQSAPGVSLVGTAE
jgi:hypothetical protein